MILDLVSGMFVNVASALFGMALRSDRHPLRDSRVQGALWAPTGRVHNIGSDWSVGSCDLSPGHISFAPSLGIVGKREIDVLELRPLTDRVIPQFSLPWNFSAKFVISTAKGDLHWLIPQLAARGAHELLFPAAAPAVPD